MTKKRLFANNWKEYRDTPCELFPEVPFDEYMDWRVHGWEILPSHCCLIRTRTKTGKVKEYSYKRWSAAEKRINRLMDDPEMLEITIADNEEVQLIQRGTNDE
jgi:hypothetical protein|tara:strand:- start:354 stop:662 length:309 start_codon:yes stop_codon:yes gene_type:complete